MLKDIGRQKKTYAATPFHLDYVPNFFVGLSLVECHPMFWLINMFVAYLDSDRYNSILPDHLFVASNSFFFRLAGLLRGPSPIWQYINTIK